MVLAAARPNDAKCPLVKKLPALKKTGYDEEDLDAKLMREAFIECLEVLWAHPEECLACSKWLKARVERHTNSGPKDEEFMEAPATLGQVDEQWLASYLKETLGMSDAVLGKMKAFDPESLKQLVCSKLNVAPTLKMPSECKNRLVVKAAFDARAAETKRIETVSIRQGGDIDPATGKLNWGSLGVFELQSVEGGGHRVLHRPTNTYAPIDADLCVTGTWWIDDNFSSAKAALVKSKARRYKLIDFFDKRGPAQKDKPLVGTSEVWGNIVQQAQQVVDANRLKAKEGTIATCGPAFETPSKEIVKVSTKRAREALLLKQEERMTKRRVVVT